ncbi:ribonuclease H-like domain-containing protein [Tanacetum coccineum]
MCKAIWQCGGLYYLDCEDPVLGVLKPELKIDNTKQTEYYETCQRAKQTREPFPLSDHSSSSLGELVHLDLWGPYKVTSFEGFKFFLTVVDDTPGLAESRILILNRSESGSNVFQDINHLNFFDLDYPEIPSDENSDDPSLNSDSVDHSDSSHSPISGEKDDTNDRSRSLELMLILVITFMPLRMSRKWKHYLEMNTRDLVDLPKDGKLLVESWLWKLRSSLVSDNGVFLVLLIYVDDIIIIGNDTSEINKFKEFLRTKFMIKDLGNLKYFLRIEVINTDKVSISNEATSIDPLLDNIVDYQKLMRKLIYLLLNTKTRHSYAACFVEFINDDENVTLISKLDVSNPLHLHPNDSAALTIVSVKLKETENYHVWSNAMLLDLEGRNKTGFIDGSCRRSNVDEVLGRQWDRVNAVVLGWILNSITEELFLGQIFSKRARHVWEELKETYDKVDGSVTFNLHHKIHTLKQNGSTLADYYHSLNALWKQFDCLIELPRCTCHAADDFKKHNQLMKLMQFLMGLDDSYMSIRSSILSRETLPVFEMLCYYISEESKGLFSSSLLVSQRSQTAAFASNVPNRTNFQRGQTSNNNSRPMSANNSGPRPNNANMNRQSGGSGLVCENCGFNGHTIDRCFKLIGYPADFGKKRNGQNFKGKSVSNHSASGSNVSSGFTDEQLSTLISLIKDNSISGKIVQANMAGTVVNNSKIFNDNFDKFFCSNANLKSKVVASRKIVDSGANQHMTDSDKGLYNVHDISHLKIKVAHPNGTETFISKIGSLKLPNGLILFELNNCYGIVSCGGLYYLDCEGINCNKSSVHIQSCLSQHDWHCRLGHPADPVLGVLKPELKIDNTKQTEYCETCQRAKQTREPFPLSDHTSSSLGDLVHLDLWGPYKVTSSEGLPSSVLNGKSPFEMIYNTKPNLSKLRVFGCLCFATVLNNHDKLGSRSEKCIMMGYSSVKKGYRLYSLDKHQFIYSRDVKFFETVFPFKDSNLNNSGIDADISDHFHATQDEQVTTLEENIMSKGNKDINPVTNSQGTQNLRRSSRQSVFPKNYNDFVVESKVKYGLEKFVVAPNVRSKEDDEMEMEASLRNDTWDLVDLPKDRKAWIMKNDPSDLSFTLSSAQFNAFMLSSLPSTATITVPKYTRAIYIVVGYEGPDPGDPNGGYVAKINLPGRFDKTRLSVFHNHRVHYTYLT